MTRTSDLIRKERTPPYRPPYQNAIPCILPSSGTIGNNGALSALTALPTTYTSAYLYFPVDTIAAGVAAGLYYCVMSSTTAGTIYNNVYDPSLGVLPTIPASPTAFVTTGPGAYTQTTGSVISLVGYTIPGGSMGANGRFILSGVYSQTNNADAKVLSVTFGGSSFMATGIASTAAWGMHKSMSNRGSASKQVCSAVALTTDSIGSQASNIPIQLTVNTAVDQILLLGAQLTAVATNNIGVETSKVEVFFQ